MKKILICLFTLTILTGCKDNYITCKIDLNNEQDNYKQSSEYKIYYKNSFVTKVSKLDIYESNNVEELKYLEEINQLTLDNYSSGFEYEMGTSDNKLVIKTEIDMNKVNLKETKISKDSIVSKKVILSGLVDYYESKGAVCDE